MIPLPYLVAGVVIAIALAFGGGFAKGRAFGVDVTTAKYETAIAAEAKRQKDANDKARQEGDAIVAALQEKNSELAELLADNAEAAARDPDAGRACVSPGGVLRLNKVR